MQADIPIHSSITLITPLSHVARYILSRTATKALSCLLFGSHGLIRTFSHLSFDERRSISRMLD
ncbi:hypothetical protein ELG70_39125, partial [Rhizobium leguminosarum]